MALTRDLFDQVKSNTPFIVGERFLSAQANALFVACRQLEFVADRAAVSNWGPVITPSLGSLNIGAYDPASGFWIFPRASGAVPEVHTTTDSFETFWSRTLPIASNFTPTSIAVDGAGTVVIGANVSSGTDAKYMRSIDCATWTAADATVSDTISARPIIWHPSSNQFVAIFVGDRIETSADGTSWSAGTLPASFTASALSWDCDEAIGGSRIIITRASTDTYITTTNGVDWSDGTFPVSGNFRVTFVKGQALGASQSGKWYAISATTGYSSTDGVNWSGPFTSSITAQSLTSIGSLLMIGGDVGRTVFAYGTDGVSWTRAHESSGTGQAQGGFVKSDHRVIALLGASPTTFRASAGF